MVTSGYIKCFLHSNSMFQQNHHLNKIALWDDATPWEELAKDRLEAYKKAGLVLRGARHRENMSQMQLAQKSKVHQNEISKIENGKRAVGKQVAQRLAEALNFDYRLLLLDLENSY